MFDSGLSSVTSRVVGVDPDAPTLALMGHTDVVPVTEASWTRDPFGGEVVDGVLWGRGAVDMLNLTAAMAVVTREVIDGDLPTPPGGLVYLAVADEEAGGTWGAEWMFEHHPDAIDAGAPAIWRRIEWDQSASDGAIRVAFDCGNASNGSDFTFGDWGEGEGVAYPFRSDENVPSFVLASATATAASTSRHWQRSGSSRRTAWSSRPGTPPRRVRHGASTR